MAVVCAVPWDNALHNRMRAVGVSVAMHVAVYGSMEVLVLVELHLADYRVAAFRSPVKAVIGVNVFIASLPSSTTASISFSIQWGVSYVKSLALTSNHP